MVLCPNGKAAFLYFGGKGKYFSKKYKILCFLICNVNILCYTYQSCLPNELFVSTLGTVIYFNHAA